ncbi:MAG TPA: sigma-70 family RNA polymerase sigma factor [Anaerolineales bacterium]|nr:sigma-70 family RNA polymerase sigma factor [Anaerolineales bacterium]
MEPKTEDLPAKHAVERQCGQAIHRLKRGDIGGLECLIARYQGKALRTAFLITHNEQMAEDVVQDAFVRFYQRANCFDASRPFEPYFMRSVVNAALNCIEREKKARTFTEADTSELESLLEEAASVEEQVEFNTLKWQIMEVLAELPPRQRAVIVQRYYLEMSEKEMSEALDSPPGTIKWLLNAARDRLRSLLGSERMAE